MHGLWAGDFKGNEIGFTVSAFTSGLGYNEK